MGSRPRPLNAVIKDPQHFRRVAECIQDMNTRQDYMDLCFVCARGHRVYAHKLLLCAVSSHMKEMILENPDRHDLVTIHLPDVEARLLRLMFDFFYEGDLHVIKTDYAELQKLMTLLGVNLKSRSQKTSQSGAPSQPVQPQPVQFVCVQAPGSNNQGQMQYMIATPAMLSGQMMQVASGPTASMPQPQMMQMTTSTSVPQGQMMQVPAPTASHPQGQMMQVMQVGQAGGTGQVMQVSAPTTSLPQSQIMQMPPAIMSQASGQMVQGGLQEVPTPLQQNSIMQVVPQSSAQVPQPTQRPQYIMSSTSNQMTTSRTQAQYTQPQTTPQQRIARSRTTNQLAQPTRTGAINSVRTRRMMRAPMPMAQNRSLPATRTVQRTRHSAQ